jgi:hypothetical protein
MTRPESSTVTGAFHDRDVVVGAIEYLADHGIPVGQIEVVLVDEEGFHRRDVSIRREIGLPRGIALGGALGGVLGAAALILITAASGGQGDASTTGSLATAVIRGAGAGAGAGTPLGILVGLGGWRGRVGLSRDEVDEGAVLVSVKGADLSTKAGSLLAAAGATNLTE